MTFANVTADQIQYFLLVFVRVVTIVSFLPVLGSQNAPPAVKIGLAVALSVIVFPLLPPVPEASAAASTLAVFVLMIIKELFIGLVLGYAASFLFVAVQFAGRLIDTEMGFAFVELVDPFTDMPTTTMGQMKIMVFTMVFLLINGHYFLILAIQRSFEVIPVLGAHLPNGQAAQYLSAMVGHTFDWALKLAAPVYISLLLAEVALGVIARTVPQMNIFFVGLPMKIIMGMATAAIAFPMLVPVFKRVAEGVVRDMWVLLNLMA